MADTVRTVSDGFGRFGLDGLVRTVSDGSDHGTVRTTVGIYGLRLASN